MRRTLLAIALLGCGSPAPVSKTTMQPEPVAVAPPVPTPAPDPTPTPAPPPPGDPAEMTEPPREEPKDLPCAPRMESWPEGHHDRYVFHDEKLERSGYKNKAGAIVIKPRFREAYPFGPGGIAAVSDPKAGLGYINPRGKMIAKAHPMDNGPDYFQDKLARIIGKGGKIGYIDDTGKIVIPPKFDAAMPFCDGTAEVELRGKPMKITKTGAAVL